MDERQREFAERLSAAGVEITEELEGVDEPRRENLLDFMLRQERKAARILRGRVEEMRNDLANLEVDLGVADRLILFMEGMQKVQYGGPPGE